MSRDTFQSEDTAKIFNATDTSRTVKLKVTGRRSSGKPATNWKKRVEQLESQDDKPPVSSDSPSPLVTPLGETESSSFVNGRPLEDDPEYTVCKYCKKPILKNTAVPHIKACLRVKSEKTKERKKEKAAAAAAAAAGKDGALSLVNGEETVDNVAGNGDDKKKGAKKTKADGPKSKKRKVDEAKLPKEPKAKKKKEKPAKPDPKPKAPVDVEKQCGVPLNNGALCARSLTCKSHSMGAKRGVLGRSQPYDVLLAAYQKKNQAKQQKAAINAGAPPAEEVEANALPVDSDEETELVMSAISRNIPRPLESQIFVPVRKKSQYLRMRELMASALRPSAIVFGNENGGPGSFANGIALSMGSQLAQKSFQVSSVQSQRRSSVQVTS